MKRYIRAFDYVMATVALGVCALSLYLNDSIKGKEYSSDVDMAPAHAPHDWHDYRQKRSSQDLSFLTPSRSEAARGAIGWQTFDTFKPEWRSQVADFMRPDKESERPDQHRSEWD